MDTVNINNSSTYHHEDLKSELLEKALEILDAEGPDQLGVRRLARELGVAHSAPANHFKTKSILLTELATLIFKDIEIAVRLNLQTGDKNPAEKIRAIAQSVFEFGLKYPNRYRFVWRLDLVKHEDPNIEGQMDKIYDLMRTSMSHERYNEQSIDTKAVALWSLIHGYLIMRIEGTLIDKNDENTGRKRQEEIIEILINGLNMGIKQ